MTNGFCIATTRALACLLIAPLTGCFQPPDPMETFSGTWQEQAHRPSTHSGTAVSYRLTNGTFQATMDDGRSFEAVLGGGDAELTGEPPMTVSVDRTSAIAIRQVFKKDRKPVQVVTVVIVNGDTLLAVEQEGGKPPALTLAARQ